MAEQARRFLWVSLIMSAIKRRWKSHRPAKPNMSRVNSLNDNLLYGQLGFFMDDVLLGVDRPHKEI